MSGPIIYILLKPADSTPSVHDAVEIGEERHAFFALRFKYKTTRRRRMGSRSVAPPRDYSTNLHRRTRYHGARALSRDSKRRSFRPSQHSHTDEMNITTKSPLRKEREYVEKDKRTLDHPIFENSRTVKSVTAERPGYHYG